MLERRIEACLKETFGVSSSQSTKPLGKLAVVICTGDRLTVPAGGAANRGRVQHGEPFPWRSGVSRRLQPVQCRLVYADGVG
jgi:hypothetical protein